MSSHSHELPNEILLQIFDRLSFCRKDIAACRLVSKQFHHLSSQFLIRRVVFACRVDTLRRLLEVLEHPYFHKHVVELVYDASTYHEVFATRFTTYSETCHTSSTRSYGPCPRSEKERLQYADFYHQVSQQEWPPQDYDWSQGSGNCPSGCESALERSDSIGFHEYHERWAYQERMLFDGLHSILLHKALAGLPRLQRIVYTDFRELSKVDESYAELCERLFGHSLEPLGLTASRHHGKDFLLLLDAIADTADLGLRSLSIGGHPYESQLKMMDRHGGCVSDWTLPHEIPGLKINLLVDDSSNKTGRRYWSSLFEGKDTSNRIKRRAGVFEGLHHLRLAFRLEEGQARLQPSALPQAFSTCMRAAAPTLIKLTLSGVGLLKVVVDCSGGQFLSGRGNTAILEMLMCAFTFPSLQHLALHGWPLPGREKLEEFFSRHTSTLKELILTYCVTSENLQPLAEWAGENMLLDSVEFRVEDIRVAPDGFYLEGRRMANWQFRRNEDLELLWLAGTHNYRICEEPEEIGNRGQ